MSASYERSPATPAGMAGDFMTTRPRVSWSAIFAGVVLVIAIELVLSVLGAGVGLGFVKPNAGTTPDASSFGAGAGLWWLVSSIIALAAGSFAAARLAGAGTRFDGALHGLVIWGLALVMTVYLVTSAVGGLVGGAFSVIGGTMSAAGSAVSSAGTGVASALPQLEQVTGINPNVLQQQAEEVLQSPTPSDPASMNRADATKAVGQALPDLIAGGDKSDAAKQRITEIVAAQAHISPQDAQKRVEDAQARIVNLKNQAVQKAKTATDASAAVTSRASFWAFFGFLIGAAAGAAGGAMAAPRRAVVAGARFP